MALITLILFWIAFFIEQRPLFTSFLGCSLFYVVILLIMLSRTGRSRLFLGWLVMIFMASFFLFNGLSDRIYWDQKVALLILSLGTICNVLVMGVNGFQMPVRINLVYISYLSFRHKKMDKKCRLCWLGDIFDYNLGICSIGDILVLNGVIILFISAVISRFF